MCALGVLVTKMTAKLHSGIALLAIVLIGSLPAFGHDLSLEGGWAVDSRQSSVSFIMSKKGTVVEIGSFSSLQGTIDEAGQGEFVLDMRSVSTGTDIRDVRLRFLLFEVQKFQNAEISFDLDQAALAGLRDRDMREFTQPVVVSFRDNRVTYDADLRVHALDDDLVSVSLRKPIVVTASDFDLAEGFTKLEEAVQVNIVPATSITFDLVMRPKVTN